LTTQSSIYIRSPRGGISSNYLIAWRLSLYWSSTKFRGVFGFSGTLIRPYLVEAFCLSAQSCLFSWRKTYLSCIERCIGCSTDVLEGLIHRIGKRSSEKSCCSFHSLDGDNLVTLDSVALPLNTVRSDNSWTEELIQKQYSTRSLRRISV